MTRPRGRRLALLVLAAVLPPGLSACGAESAPDAGAPDPAQFAAESLDTVPDTTPTTTPPTTEVVIVGAVIEPFALETGDCFNQIDRLVDGKQVTTTARVGCDGPHGYQVFHRLEYPAPYPSVYPGEAAMRRFALQSCYPAFAPWVGEDYEVSELEIGVIIPPRTNFEDSRARYRGIHCWVERVDGEPMPASAQGSGW
ncbi:MAG: septum formation family protein [Acidimicrobiales bacterium]